MDFGDEKFTKKKNRRKFLRVILEFVILLGLGYLLAMALFTFKHYVPYQERKDVPVSEDKGFVALSAPAGTPDDVVAALRDLMGKAVESDEYKT